MKRWDIILETPNRCQSATRSVHQRPLIIYRNHRTVAEKLQISNIVSIESGRYISYYRCYAVDLY